MFSLNAPKLRAELVLSMMVEIRDGVRSHWEELNPLRQMVLKSLDISCVVLNGSFQVKIFLPYVSQVALQARHDRFQAI